MTLTPSAHDGSNRRLYNVREHSTSVALKRASQFAVARQPRGPRQVVAEITWKGMWESAKSTATKLTSRTLPVAMADPADMKPNYSSLHQSHQPDVCPPSQNRALEPFHLNERLRRASSRSP